MEDNVENGQRMRGSESRTNVAVLPFQFAAPEAGHQPLEEVKNGLSALSHDAHNMVTALGIYCELLERPGVLNPKALHLIDELQLITRASRKLVEQINEALRSQHAVNFYMPSAAANRSATSDTLTPSDSTPIQNLAQELRRNRNLLSALAGPSIQLSLHTTAAGEAPVRLRSEELTRILVNLVRNAVEAMPYGGELTLALAEAQTAHFEKKAGELLLTISDTGPGIPAELREAVFTAGFTGHAEADPDSNWHGQHRGLGLAITRAIIEAAGGSIRAVASNRGACFEITLPVGA